MSFAIRFKNVSKKFKMHWQRATSFQQILVDLVDWRKKKGSTGDYWALKNVDFEIEKGESIAFIGPNGTGKSTSLKLIAGILMPTSGQIEIDGRVGALLELGAGFHPDLTGRENIFLNGAILGLNKHDIRQKMDQIIDFSELKRFIDIPVRHYSSGMYMRLGFSIAIHTDPDILLVDEILAVGDASFQQKCVTRIGELQNAGVTIVFVSHSLDFVRDICQRVIWMENGEIIADGSADSVIKRYLHHSFKTGTDQEIHQNDRRWGNQKISITKVSILDENGNEQDSFVTGQAIRVIIHYQASERIEQPVFGIAIHNNEGIHITGPNTMFSGYEIPAVYGSGKVVYKIPSLNLLEGVYFFSIAVHHQDGLQMFDYHDRKYKIYVMPDGAERYGIISLQGEWSWQPEY